MRMNGDGKIMFEVGDRVRPRTVLRPDDNGKPVKVGHPKAYGGIRIDDKTKQIAEKGLEDVVAYVDDASLQIQLRSWKEAADNHPERYISMRSRWETYEWYDAVDPEDDKPKVRRGAGTSAVG